LVIIEYIEAMFWRCENLNININARSTMAILAVAVVLLISTGATLNQPELLETGTSLFLWLLFGIIAVTIIINISRRH
jgi:hypothetical protein